MATTMITCGDHQRAPATLVCVHLAEGLSKNWYAMTVDGSEIPEGWVCPECEPHSWDIRLDGWRLMCMHCIRRLQAVPGSKVTIDEYKA
jgi:hypothetical protein